jgi:hypothetical protein
MIKLLVDRFLAWPLPKTVCSDLCVTECSYPHERSGTNLLTADEAAQMFKHVLGSAPDTVMITRKELEAAIWFAGPFNEPDRFLCYDILWSQLATKSRDKDE